jgi:hypothetical protein
MSSGNHLNEWEDYMAEVDRDNNCPQLGQGGTAHIAPDEADERRNKGALGVDQQDGRHIDQEEQNRVDQRGPQVMSLSDSDHIGRSEAAYRVLQGVALEEETHETDHIHL